MDKCEGVVKSWSRLKGYGFIVHNGQDVFVHYSVLPGRSGDRNLNVGDVVVFIGEYTDKGMRATSVSSIIRGSR